MSICRMWNIVCDRCEEPLAVDTYLTEARQQVRDTGGISKPGGPDLCVKCIPKDAREVRG